MTLQDLKYLVNIAKYKHFGKAAQASHISQPSLSMQIKKLEEYLGITLIERRYKNIRLTETGQQVVHVAQEMLALQKDIVDICKHAQNPLTGTLTLGIIPTMAPYLSPKVAQLIHQSFPQIKLHLYEGQTHVITKKLEQGELDVILLALPIAGEHLVQEPLFNEEFLLAVYPGHKLAGKKRLKPSILKNEKILLLEDGHCLRDQSLEFCQMIGALEQQEFRATSLETLRSMVAAEAGITLIPHMAQKENDGLIYLKFMQPQPQRTIGLCWRKSSPKEGLCLKIRDLFKERLK